MNSGSIMINRKGWSLLHNSTITDGFVTDYVTKCNSGIARHTLKHGQWEHDFSDVRENQECSNTQLRLALTSIDCQLNIFLQCLSKITDNTIKSYSIKYTQRVLFEDISKDGVSSGILYEYNEIAEVTVYSFSLGESYYCSDYLIGSDTSPISSISIERLITHLIDKIKIAPTISKITVDPGNYPVIFMFETASLLIHELFGHMLESDVACTELLNKNLHLCTDILLRDMAHVRNGFVTICCDNEGTIAHDEMLIDKGRVVNTMDTLMYASGKSIQHKGFARASMLKNKPLPRMRSLYLHKGKTAITDKLDTITKGLLIEKAGSEVAIYPKVNLFWMDILESWYIKDGKKISRVEPFSITSSITELVSNVQPLHGIIFTLHGFCSKMEQFIPVSTASPPLYVSKIVATKSQRMS